MISLQTKQFLGKVEHQKNLDGIIASITTYPDTAYAESMHYHETFVLSMVLQGGNIERREHTSIERTSGKVTYHNPGDPHQNLCIQPLSRHLNIELSDDFLRRYDILPEAAELEHTNLPDAAFLMCRLYKQFCSGQTGTLAIEPLVLQLLHRPKKCRIAGNNPAWVGRVREILHDSWNEPLELTVLAKAACMHPANLSAYFPAYFGCTITDMRRKIKLEKALSLVKQGKLSLTQIAYECGFADQSHFIRVCKALTACTPSQLKRMFSSCPGRLNASNFS